MHDTWSILLQIKINRGQKCLWWLNSCLETWQQRNWLSRISDGVPSGSDPLCLLTPPSLADKMGSVSAPCVPGLEGSWLPWCTFWGASVLRLPWCCVVCALCWALPSPCCCLRPPISPCLTPLKMWRDPTSGLTHALSDQCFLICFLLLHVKLFPLYVCHSCMERYH